MVKSVNKTSYLIKIIIALEVIILPYLIYRSVLLPIQFPEQYSARLMIGMGIVYLVVLAILYRMLHHLSDRMLSILAGMLIAAAVVIQVYIAASMQVVPDTDLISIIEQNRELVESGEHFFSDKEYFSINTNNIPLGIVIYWVFRITALLGCHNYELAGGLFNVGMNLLTYLAGYGIARQIASHRTAVIFLFILVSNPTLYAYASYYYTDTISLGVASMAVYAGVCAMQRTLVLSNSIRHNRNEEIPGKSLMREKIINGSLFLLSGVLMCWASLIRVTSAFVAIAAVVYAAILLLGRRKSQDSFQSNCKQGNCRLVESNASDESEEEKPEEAEQIDVSQKVGIRRPSKGWFLHQVIIPLLIGILLAAGLYSMLYRYHINYETSDAALPWQHFVAMGANAESNGQFSYNDYLETVQQPTKEEKAAYNIQKWEDRIHENGIAGEFRLVLEKETIVWSYGSKHYYQYLQFVKELTPLYEWLEGNHAIYFRSYMQLYDCFLLIAMLVSLVTALRQRFYSALHSVFCIAAIDWFGAVLFYILWEAHSRQSVSYLLMMSLLLLPMLQTFDTGEHYMGRRKAS